MVMSYQVAKNGVNFWITNNKSERLHCTRVIESALFHHRYTRMIFMWIIFFDTLLKPAIFSGQYIYLTVLKRSVLFLLGIGALLRLVLKRWHICLGPFVCKGIVSPISSSLYSSWHCTAFLSSMEELRKHLPMCLSQKVTQSTSFIFFLNVAQI